MRNITLPGVLVAAALCAASPAGATVTFGNLSFVGRAQALGGELDEAVLSANALPTEYLLDSATSTYGFGGVARISLVAGFDDAANGRLLMNHIQADGYLTPGQDAGTATGGTASGTYSYTFTVDRSYILRLNYGNTYFGTNNSVAQHDADLYWKILTSGGDTVTGDQLPLMAYDLTFSSAFGPGTYTLEIGALASTLATPADHNSAVDLSTSISFTLLPNGRAPASPTPEPATWALMIGGFSLAGSALRRRRTVTA